MAHGWKEFQFLPQDLHFVSLWVIQKKQISDNVTQCAYIIIIIIITF